METKYIIEVRDETGKLDFEKEKEIKKLHPYLFSKPTFTIDNLCYTKGRKKTTVACPVDEFLLLKNNLKIF